MKDQVGTKAEMDDGNYTRIDKLSTMSESPLEQEWYESDLQLAAELGKTLLERNKELESNLKQQQQIIEDKTLEIEYLTKQMNSLREVNETRLKVYEQLEISLQDLEKSNQKLQHESGVDKKKLRSMCSIVETLERKCEELQKSVDELRVANRQQLHNKRRERRRTLGLGMEFDTAELRRVMSVENGLSQHSDERHLWDAEKEAEYLRLQQSARELKTQKSREQRLREELELELACIMQDNEQLREQLNALQQKEVIIKALQLEIQEMEEEYSSHLCCCPRHKHNGSSSHPKPLTILDSEHEVEDEAPNPSLEHCALVKLHNGGQAYGSEEALTSVGQVISNDKQEEREASSLESSLLSELDAQYRLLIKKYEAMVSARCRMERGNAAAQFKLRSESCSDVEEDAEKEYHAMAWNGGSVEESSSTSSGFSDGGSDVGQAHKAVQTDGRYYAPGPFTRGEPSASRNLPNNLRAQCNPLENHFNHTPEYKKLFQEIFAVLKKSISMDGGDSSAVPPTITDHQEAFPALCCHRSETSSRQSTPDRSYADVVSSGSCPASRPVSRRRK